MSGPKVVRIVTREELRAQSNAIAARLEEAVRRWEAAARAAGELTQGELDHSRENQARWLQELQADRFAAFDEGANREIAFLKADADRRREVAAARRANARLSRARASQNAALLIKTLDGKKVAFEQSLRDLLEATAAGRGDSKAADAALSAGFRLLSAGSESASVPSVSAVATQVQRALARRLAEGTPDRSFSDWKEAERVQRLTVDPRLEVLARQLEMLRLLDDSPETVAALEARLDEVVRSEEGAKRSMQLDTLGIELTRAVREWREFATLADDAAGVLAELARLGEDKSADARPYLVDALASRDTKSLAAAVQGARVALADIAKVAAARSRRSAVLAGLEKLGYAVNEGMETAWTESGRVVLQKPSLNGYGVELAGAADAQRMQVRTVALDEERSAARDLDAEHLWCGDFDKLKEDLANAGSNVLVERAMGVGTVALKVVQPANKPAADAASQARRTSAGAARKAGS